MTAADQIKADEGLRLTPYQDTVGKWTIGFGTNLSDGITRDEAEYLFANRFNTVHIELARVLPWLTTLNEPRQAVLLGMAYNMGVAGLLQFNRTLQLVEEEQWDAAAAEMLRSKWATQVRQRAYRLAEQMRTGEWQT